MSSGSEHKCLKLWYISSELDPGRSTLPHPLINKVSPETKLLLTLKHWDPGVCPGVWRNSISFSPILRWSPESTTCKSESSSPVTFFTPLLPYAMAFAAGAMIFVVVEEVIPETQQDKYTDIATLGFIGGFIVMMILDVALG